MALLQSSRRTAISLVLLLLVLLHDSGPAGGVAAHSSEETTPYWLTSPEALEEYHKQRQKEKQEQVSILQEQSLLSTTTLQQQQQDITTIGCDPLQSPIIRMKIPRDSFTITVDDLCGSSAPAVSDDAGVNVIRMDQGSFVQFDVLLPISAYYKVRVRTRGQEGALEIRDAASGEIFAVHRSFQLETSSSDERDVGIMVIREGGTTLTLESLRSGWEFESIEFTVSQVFPEFESFDYVAGADIFNNDNIEEHWELVEGTNLTALAWVRPGDLFDFDLKVNHTARYMMYARISNDHGDDHRLQEIEIYNRTSYQLLQNTTDLPTTRGGYVTVEVGSMVLSGGVNHLSLLAYRGGWNLLFVALHYIEPGDFSENQPIFRIPARFYNKELSEGVFFIDPANKNIGAIRDGVRIHYTLDVVTAGTYDLGFWMTSPNGWGKFDVEFEENVNIEPIRGLDVSTSPEKGWHEFKIQPIGTMDLPVGPTDMTIAVEWGGCSILSVFPSFNLFDIEYSLLV